MSGKRSHLPWGSTRRSADWSRDSKGGRRAPVVGDVRACKSSRAATGRLSDFTCRCQCKGINTSGPKTQKKEEKERRDGSTRRSFETHATEHLSLPVRGHHTPEKLMESRGSVVEDCRRRLLLCSMPGRVMAAPRHRQLSAPPLPAPALPYGGSMDPTEDSPGPAITTCTVQ